MSIPRFFRTGIATLALAVASAGHASDVPSKIESLGGNTYTITTSANNKFTRDTGKLKTRATDEADAFCTKQGKHLKIVSVTENKGLYLIGEMATATLTFKALDLTDPEFAKPAAASAGAASAGVGVDAAVEPVTNEALYADLLRLDELRKKGILTQEEFQAEKKKVLDRSK